MNDTVDVRWNGGEHTRVTSMYSISHAMQIEFWILETIRWSNCMEFFIFRNVFLSGDNAVVSVCIWIARSQVIMISEWKQNLIVWMVYRALNSKKMYWFICRWNELRQNKWVYLFLTLVVCRSSFIVVRQYADADSFVLSRVAVGRLECIISCVMQQS